MCYPLPAHEKTNILKGLNLETSGNKSKLIERIIDNKLDCNAAYNVQKKGGKFSPPEGCKAINFSNPLSQKIDLINKLSDYFKSINENFDRDKFSSACLGGK